MLDLDRYCHAIGGYGDLGHGIDTLKRKNPSAMAGARVGRNTTD
jgi:hypothetical protein